MHARTHPHIRADSFLGKEEARRLVCPFLLFSASCVSFYSLTSPFCVVFFSARVITVCLSSLVLVFFDPQNFFRSCIVYVLHYFISVSIVVLRRFFFVVGGRASLFCAGAFVFV